jgi:radical SAM protein with 4Fe4S-binding SPASM domain
MKNNNQIEQIRKLLKFLHIYKLYQSIENIIKTKTNLYPYYGKFKYKLGFKSQVDLEIAITFGCNINCNYCYAKGLEKNIEPITINNFKKILNWLKSQNKNKIRLIGGEPTNHPKIKKILNLCNKNNFKYELVSNGIYDHKLNKYINNQNTTFVLFNYNFKNSINNKHKILLKNIEILAKKKILIDIKYNITKNSNNQEIIKIAKKYNLNINFSAPNLGFSNKEYINWNKNQKKISKKIVDFVKQCNQNGIFCYIGRPVPRCAFSNNNWKFLKKFAYIKSKCDITKKNSSDGGYQVIPDLRIFACANLFATNNKQITDYKNISEIKKEYKDYINLIRWKIPLLEKCKKCKFFLIKKCQGGCLGNKLNKIPQFENIELIKNNIL